MSGFSYLLKNYVKILTILSLANLLSLKFNLTFLLNFILSLNIEVANTLEMFHQILKSKFKYFLRYFFWDEVFLDWAHLILLKILSYFRLNTIGLALANYLILVKQLFYFFLITIFLILDDLQKFITFIFYFKSNSIIVDLV